MSNYRNRIKALESVSSADLVSHPGNWREHGKAQADALKGVLSEVGIAGALLAYRSERQGGALVVIDGHLRKDAAPQKWPVLILDVDDAEADYLLATHDPLAAMATADAGALDALLSSVQSGEAAVQQMLAELARRLAGRGVRLCPCYSSSGCLRGRPASGRCPPHWGTGSPARSRAALTVTL